MPEVARLDETVQWSDEISKETGDVVSGTTFARSARSISSPTVSS